MGDRVPPRKPKKSGARPEGTSGKKKARSNEVAGTARSPDKRARKGLFRRKRAEREPAVPSNRRTQPKPDAPPPPPKPTLRQRMRVTRERIRAGWVRMRRPLTWVGKGLVALAIALGAVGVGQLVERHLRTSPAFAIQEVHLDGAERLGRREVLAAAGLRMGQNAFEVGPQDAEGRLSGHPWVAEVSVERRLPGTFFITLREHRPAALLAMDGVLYLVSDEGVAFKRAGPGDPADLPVITGVSRERFSDGHFRAEGLMEVVALLHAYRSAGLWRREPIGEIHVEPDDGLSLYLGDDAFLVRLGRGPHRRKLRKLRRVLDRLEAEDHRPAYVYLDNVRRADRVTVQVR